MQNPTTVYLAFTDPDMQHQREELKQTLLKAGFRVLPEYEMPGEESFPANQPLHDLQHSGCSIHLVGNISGNKKSEWGGESITSWQYKEAIKRLQNGEAFKIFIWHPRSLDECTDPFQQVFISSLQNNIETNMTYTNTPSIIQLADDIRSMLEVSDKPDFNLGHTEIFFISNLVDDLSAEEITDMLSDVTQVEKLSIEPNRDKDYAEWSSQQMRKSKLAVVYFKDTAEWAIPFAQQVWKKAGGAASETPILIIGDEDPESNKNKGFKAPRVTSMVMSGELIPLEIKVQYDKVTGA